MNKIIEELSQKAIEKVSKLRMVDDQEEYSWKPEDYDRAFAELIVRECAEQIRLQGTDWIDWQPSQQGIRPEYVAMAEHIKQHFGVEG
jgi:hypothetical protein